MMRCHFLVGFAVVGGLSASPASARFGHCHAYAPNAVPFDSSGHQLFPQILSGILDFGENSENHLEVEKAFEAFVRSNSVSCTGVYPTVSAAQDVKDARIGVSGGRDTDTGWTGRFAPAAKTTPTTPSGAFISIKDNGNAARAKAWDDAVLEGQRQEAQRKVLDAASTSENDPKVKALIAAFLERLRKLGRRQ